MRVDSTCIVLFLITRLHVKSTRTAAHKSYRAACRIDTQIFTVHKLKFSRFFRIKVVQLSKERHLLSEFETIFESCQRSLSLKCRTLIAIQNILIDKSRLSIDKIFKLIELTILITDQ
jgi:hypothetical protein